MTAKCFAVYWWKPPHLLNALCCIKHWVCLKGVDEKGPIVEPFEVWVKSSHRFLNSGSDSRCEERDGRENLIQGDLLVFKQGTMLVLVIGYPFSFYSEKGRWRKHFWHPIDVHPVLEQNMETLSIMAAWMCQSAKDDPHMNIVMKMERTLYMQPCLANPLTNRPSSYSESCCLVYFKGQCLSEECDILGHLCNCLIM